VKTAIAFLAILKKDMRNYYLKPPNISWGIIFPFAWMLMLLVRNKGGIDAAGVFPGIVAMAVIFGTTSMLSVTITFERRARSFDRLLAAPLSMTALVLGKISGAALFGVFNSLVPVLVCTLLFGAPVADLAALAGGVLSLSAVSTLIGLFVAVSVSEVFEAQTFSNFFRFPMIFLCGLFIPLTDLPVWLRPLSYALPVTYGVDLLRHGTAGAGALPVLLDVSVLCAATALLFAGSVLMIRKKWFP
jgi:ABC-2 type transport system permease protein